MTSDSTSSASASRARLRKGKDRVSSDDEEATSSEWSHSDNSRSAGEKKLVIFLRKRWSKLWASISRFSVPLWVLLGLQVATIVAVFAAMTAVWSTEMEKNIEKEVIERLNAHMSYVNEALLHPFQVGHDASENIIAIILGNREVFRPKESLLNLDMSLVYGNTTYTTYTSGSTTNISNTTTSPLSSVVAFTADHLSLSDERAFLHLAGTFASSSPFIQSISQITESRVLLSPDDGLPQTNVLSAESYKANSQPSVVVDSKIWNNTIYEALVAASSVSYDVALERGSSGSVVHVVDSNNTDNSNKNRAFARIPVVAKPLGKLHIVDSDTLVKTRMPDTNSEKGRQWLFFPREISERFATERFPAGVYTYAAYTAIIDGVAEIDNPLLKSQREVSDAVDAALASLGGSVVEFGASSRNGTNTSSAPHIPTNSSSDSTSGNVWPSRYPNKWMLATLVDLTAIITPLLQSLTSGTDDSFASLYDVSDDNESLHRLISTSDTSFPIVKKSKNTGDNGGVVDLDDEDGSNSENEGSVDFYSPLSTPSRLLNKWYKIAYEMTKKQRRISQSSSPPSNKSDSDGDGHAGVTVPSVTIRKDGRFMSFIHIMLGHDHDRGSSSNISLSTTTLPSPSTSSQVDDNETGEPRRGDDVHRILDLMAVVSTSDEVYFGPMRRIRAGMIAFGVVAASFVVLVCVLLMFSIRLPLNRVLKNMEHTSRLETNSVDLSGMHSPLKEISDLCRSYQRVHEIVEAAKSFLPASMLARFIRESNRQASELEDDEDEEDFDDDDDDDDDDEYSDREDIGDGEGGNADDDLEAGGMWWGEENEGLPDNDGDDEDVEDGAFPNDGDTMSVASNAKRRSSVSSQNHMQIIAAVNSGMIAKKNIIAAAAALKATSNKSGEVGSSSGVKNKRQRRGGSSKKYGVTSANKYMDDNDDRGHSRHRVVKMSNTDDHCLHHNVAATSASRASVIRSSLATATAASNLTSLKSRRVAILCINIRNFTNTADFSVYTLSNHATLVMDIITRIATAERGVIDSFHGDHFVLSFNAVKAAASPAKKATLCAMAVANALEGTPFACLSMGASSGTAIVGALGNSSQRRLSIIGTCYTRALKLQKASSDLDKNVGGLFGVTSGSSSSNNNKGGGPNSQYQKQNAFSENADRGVAGNPSGSSLPSSSVIRSSVNCFSCLVDHGTLVECFDIHNSGVFSISLANASNNNNNPMLANRNKKRGGTSSSSPSAAATTIQALLLGSTSSAANNTNVIQRYLNAVRGSNNQQRRTFYNSPLELFGGGKSGGGKNNSSNNANGKFASISNVPRPSHFFAQSSGNLFKSSSSLAQQVAVGGSSLFGVQPPRNGHHGPIPNAGSAPSANPKSRGGGAHAALPESVSTLDAYLYPLEYTSSAEGRGKQNGVSSENAALVPDQSRHRYNVLGSGAEIVRGGVLAQYVHQEDMVATTTSGDESGGSGTTTTTTTTTTTGGGGFVGGMAKAGHSMSSTLSSSHNQRRIQALAEQSGSSKRNLVSVVGAATGVGNNGVANHHNNNNNNNNNNINGSNIKQKQQRLQQRNNSTGGGGGNGKSIVSPTVAMYTTTTQHCAAEDGLATVDMLDRISFNPEANKAFFNDQQGGGDAHLDEQPQSKAAHMGEEVQGEERVIFEDAPNDSHMLALNGSYEEGHQREHTASKPATRPNFNGSTTTADSRREVGETLRNGNNMNTGNMNEHNGNIHVDLLKQTSPPLALEPILDGGSRHEHHAAPPNLSFSATTTTIGAHSAVNAYPSPQSAAASSPIDGKLSSGTLRQTTLAGGLGGSQQMPTFSTRVTHILTTNANNDRAVQVQQQSQANQSEPTSTTTPNNSNSAAATAVSFASSGLMRKNRNGLTISVGSGATKNATKKSANPAGSKSTNSASTGFSTSIASLASRILANHLVYAVFIGNSANYADESDTDECDSDSDDQNNNNKRNGGANAVADVYAEEWMYELRDHDEDRANSGTNNRDGFLSGGKNSDPRLHPNKNSNNNILQNTTALVKCENAVTNNRTSILTTGGTAKNTGNPLGCVSEATERMLKGDFAGAVAAAKKRLAAFEKESELTHKESEVRDKRKEQHLRDKRKSQNFTDGHNNGEVGEDDDEGDIEIADNMSGFFSANPSQSGGGAASTTREQKVEQYKTASSVFDSADKPLNELRQKGTETRSLSSSQSSSASNVHSLEAEVLKYFIAVIGGIEEEDRYANVNMAGVSAYNSIYPSVAPLNTRTSSSNAIVFVDHQHHSQSDTSHSQSHSHSSSCNVANNPFMPTFTDTTVEPSTKRSRSASESNDKSVLVPTIASSSLSRMNNNNNNISDRVVPLADVASPVSAEPPQNAFPSSSRQAPLPLSLPTPLPSRPHVENHPNSLADLAPDHPVLNPKKKESNRAANGPRPQAPTAAVISPTRSINTPTFSSASNVVPFSTQNTHQQPKSSAAATVNLTGALAGGEMGGGSPQATFSNSPAPAASAIAADSYYHGSSGSRRGVESSSARVPYHSVVSSPYMYGGVAPQTVFSSANSSSNISLSVVLRPKDLRVPIPPHIIMALYTMFPSANPSSPANSSTKNNAGKSKNAISKNKSAAGTMTMGMGKSPSTTTSTSALASSTIPASLAWCCIQTTPIDTQTSDPLSGQTATTEAKQHMSNSMSAYSLSTTTIPTDCVNLKLTSVPLVRLRPCISSSAAAQTSSIIPASSSTGNLYAGGRGTTSVANNGGKGLTSAPPRIDEFTPNLDQQLVLFELAAWLRLLYCCELCDITGVLADDDDELVVRNIIENAKSCGVSEGEGQQQQQQQQQQNGVVSPAIIAAYEAQVASWIVKRAAKTRNLGALMAIF